jgi:predicted amidohydrolase YtcJ
MNRRSLLAGAASTFLTRCAGEPPAPLAVVNARIWTGDPKRPWASSMHLREGVVAAFDDTARAQRTIDAKGALVTPGFIDSHVHLFSAGQKLSQVQLRYVSSREEFARKISEFSTRVPPGSWILGGAWDHERWGGTLPTREWIDAASANRPVWITRLDGHMGLANTVALQTAGITRYSQSPPGGEIVRDASGEPTGVLKDNAMGMLTRIIPEPSSTELERMAGDAISHLLARGVTGIHHLGSWPELEVLARMNTEARLRLRVYAAVPLNTWDRLDAWRKENPTSSSAFFQTGLLKGFVDGSLGSHTAAMESGFTDAPSQRGLLVNTPGDLYSWISSADKARLHVAVHAIGDRANRLLLDIYERVARENGPRDRRFRVEHAQHLRPEDIPRFGQLGVIPSMQPYHCIDDGRWAEKIIGPERAKGAYPFRTLLDSGARLAFGSDWFVAPPDVNMGLYAAVTRRTLDNKRPDGWVPEQKISLEEALRAYTAGSAYAGFRESDLGTLAPGRRADFTVFDRDLTAIPPAELAEAKVRATVVDGRVEYEAA